MPTFSLASMQKLSECDIRLQQIMCKVIDLVDVTVLCGHRGKEDQEKAFNEGKSKVHYPDSNHNQLPSKAIDIAQWFPETPHIRWDDLKSFTFVAGVVKAVAAQLGYKVRWGGDWDSDNDQQDEKGLRDYPHFEVVD